MAYWPEAELVDPSGRISEAEAQVRGTEAEIVALEQRLAEAWVKRDREYIDRLLASDWSVVDQGGRILNKQQVLNEAFASDDRRIDEMTVDEIKVLVLGEAAVATGRTRATGTYRGQRATVVLRFTDVLHYREGRWQIVASQGTTVAQ
jgi:ketosteroid isomerase-like protein